MGRMKRRKDWRGEVKAGVVAVLYVLTSFALTVGNHEHDGAWILAGVGLALLTIAAAWVFFVRDARERCDE